MDNDERFLRRQIRSAVKSNKTKFISELPDQHVVMVEDEGVRRWRQGDMRGVDALKHALVFARATFKRKG